MSLPNREDYRPLPGDTTPGWTTPDEAVNLTLYCEDDLIARFEAGEPLTKFDKRDARRIIKAHAALSPRELVEDHTPNLEQKA